MDTVARIASNVAAPLVRELFADLPPAHDGPRLIASLVSFRGVRPERTYGDVTRIARELVRLARGGGASERAADEPADEPVALVLGRALVALGELDLDDVAAVRMGPQDCARRLRRAVPGADRELSGEQAWFHDQLLDNVCLHILHFLIRRSPYVAGRLAEQSHRIRQLIDLNDADAVRRSRPSPEDLAFEEAYAAALVARYNRLTIHGIDLPNAPGSWPLDSTYLSLSAEFATPVEGSSGQPALPADRALAGQERVLLRGVAGAGKTTLVQWLAVTTARNELPGEPATLRGRVPFVLPVRRFAREGFPAPEEFLTVGRCRPSVDEPPGWAVRVLVEGRALLLVDGIDEAPEARREELRAGLRRLLHIHPGTVCLVTSRPSAVEPDWLAREGFGELMLAPMSRDQVAEFIRHWHRAARHDDGGDHDRLAGYERRLLHSVRVYRELRRLATNPLMCGLICALNRDRAGTLPQGRRELYDAAMDMLLQRRDPERDVLHADNVELQRAPRERLLQKLAHRMLSEDRTELERETAVAVLDSHLPAIPAAHGQGDAEKIFGHLLHRTGLLRESDDGRVEFVHRTFQDYLSAKEIVARGGFEDLVDHAHEARWEEVVRMAAAHARPDECARFIGRLLAPCGHLKTSETKHRRLMAAACLEHVTELDPATRKLVRDRTEKIVNPTDPLGARNLGWIGPIVLELLPDPEDVPDDKAYLLAVTATRVRDEAAVDYLVRLRDRSSLRVRAELARAWRNFDTDRYAREVIAHLGEEGLYFPVSDLSELRALRDLGGRDQLQIAGRFTPGELLGEVVRERLTHLWLAYDLGVDMGWLSAFPRLRALRVNPRLPRVSGVPEGIRIITR
ncbi:NACHT domain-containing protein [Streptomyces sp. TRM43335]|uniref:NACHT domain-containing protein n=1 Tax=Streptomyces taklimakanensis TaxID=2569853 RepID=A0A6G2BDV8_9ACTN|nr:NACHT domain-containing protein [Streptomyces taklimakanensis]MTE20394.1 NACHT domain-containing protein [Streptomyces taklimakanensis]